ISSPVKPPLKATYPLPLSSNLHDLALLRASDVDFAALLPSSTTSAPTSNAALEDSVQRAIEFSRGSPAELKLLLTDAIEKEGARV
ncbi:hypothetical protein C8Q78DRAFT_929826, partial [Trametes maxima]